MCHFEPFRFCVQVERARLEADHQSKLAAMQAELDRVRDEMTYRTMVMQVRGRCMEERGDRGGCAASILLAASCCPAYIEARS